MGNREPVIGESEQSDLSDLLRKSLVASAGEGSGAVDPRCRPAEAGAECDEAS